MQPSVEQVIDQLVAAWDSGDAEAYSRLFTEDATYVIFAGAISTGRDAIRTDHEPVLAKYQKGSRMRVAIRSVRHPTEDVAIVLAEGGVGTGRRVPLDKVQTFVFRRQDDGRWLCEAFQNTRKNRLLIWLASRSTVRTGRSGSPESTAAGAPTTGPGARRMVRANRTP